MAQEQSHRPVEQTRESCINPDIYGQLIFDKRAMDINGEMTVSSTDGAGKTGQLHLGELNWTIV